MKFNKFISLGLVLLCAGCSTDTSIKTTITWEMSSEARAYYDYYQTANSDSYFKPGETFNNWLISLLNRSDDPQVMPNTIQVTHTPTLTQVNNENVYTFSDNDYDKIVLYIHGGAYVCETDKTHYTYCDGLVDAINAKVVLPLYPLAPQHTFESAYSMITTIYTSLLEENKPIYIMGDSAGGGFTLAFTEYVIANNIKAPDKIVMFSPWLDITSSNPEMADYEDVDMTLSSWGLPILANFWAGTTDQKDYRLSPIFGNLDNLPDILLFVSTDEILYPDVIKLYNEVTNTNVKLVVGNGYFHVAPIYDIPERQLSYSLINEL